MKPSFCSAHLLYKKVDVLRTRPAWDYRMLTLTGDVKDKHGKPLTEEVKLWMRNPVDCIAKLMENSSFDGSMAYALEHVYTNSTANSRIYDKM